MTGIGFAGGGLSFCVSCCPASRFPVMDQSYISGNIARAECLRDETCMGIFEWNRKDRCETCCLHTLRNNEREGDEFAAKNMRSKRYRR